MKFLKTITLVITIVSLLSMSVATTQVYASKTDVIFPQIDAQLLKSELIPVVAKGHPFILADKDNFDRVRENAFGKDKVITNQYKLIKDKATALLDEPLLRVTRDISVSSYIGTGMEFWENVMNLSFVWQIERDGRYAERAWEQTRIFCEMEHWGRYQMIDNVQTVFGVALCFDWLYDWLSEEQKQIIINALNTKHFTEILDLYENPDKPEYKWSFHQHVFSDHNHAIMDNILTFLGAMAIAGRDIDYYTKIMSYALKNLEPPFSRWYPDSAWYEGLGYWSYSAPFMARLFTTMKNSFGNCMGYENISCLMNVSDFPIYAQSSQGAFVWNDISIGIDMRIPVIYTFGVLKNDVQLQNFALNNTPIDTYPDPEFCLMYEPSTNYEEDLQLDTDKFFRETDLATMRSSFSGGQETWAAMAVQESSTNIGMMNSGTVALDALGERWIMNHGKENYYKGYWDQTGSRWQYYRTRAEANSCIVIDPSEYGGQNIYSKDVIDTFISEKGSAYAISDLTETYSGQVDSYKRGVSLSDNRRKFVVQDEIYMPKASELYSFFNLYKSDVELLPDGKSAVISKGNKKLYAEVYCDRNFELSVMESVPLPTSPIPENPNSENPDFKKLVIHFDSVRTANIRITFVPYLCDEEVVAVKDAPFVPLKEWTAEKSNNLPKISDISINGKLIEGFNPDRRYYEIVNTYTSPVITAMANSALYDVRVESDKAKNLYTIIVTDKNNPLNINSYMVDLSVKTVSSNPLTTAVHSSFDGGMMPQEFYRMENNEAKGTFYISDYAPENTARAVLTLWVKASGFSVNSKLKAKSVIWDDELKYISGANCGIGTGDDFAETIFANRESFTGDGMIRAEYDITSLIPAGGGDFIVAFLPCFADTDYHVVASHRNTNRVIRPEIQYFYK